MDKFNCNNFIIYSYICALKFVHPLRVKSYRNLTIFFTVIWAATTLRLVTKSEFALIINDTIVLITWLICTGYFTWICFIRSLKDY